MKQDKIIRNTIKGIGADIVRHCADGAWHALWYAHPHNCASDGHYVLIGRDGSEAIDYLRNYNSWANAQVS